MKISCVINSVPRTFDADPSMKLRELLVQATCACVTAMTAKASAEAIPS